MSVSITVREYNPESGALLNNISTLNYGRIIAGTTSRVKAIDFAFAGITEVANIKLGLISSGGLIVNTNPSDISADGSSANGYFGIESTAAFDSAKASQPLSRHFAGLNPSASAVSSYNVSVSNRSSLLSDYVYLDVEIGDSDTDAGAGAYKIFFDYA
jgi:hypothetical protein